MHSGKLVGLDDADKKILAQLQQDARASFKAIAEDIGVSEATVFVRVKKLKEAGILKGFRAIVDPSAIGKPLTAFILVRAQPKIYQNVLNSLKQLEDIYEIFDVTGQYYSVLKVRTTGTDQLSKIIDEIEKIEGVAGTETIIVLRTVKEETVIKI
ncbi:MAG TPA: Lrp/AsnC family transcriptional regulator [Candidatus Bathyarchaeia archaeon]|nr:Lrp/AsnC family transcriptional regulator [Candidatus Bathyarchaeia archaeon]